jgi:hypothetical protein
VVEKKYIIFLNDQTLSNLEGMFGRVVDADVSEVVVPEIKRTIKIIETTEIQKTNITFENPRERVVISNTDSDPNALTQAETINNYSKQ